MARRIELYEAETGRSLGEIGEAPLCQLFDLLEEESEADRDYWIGEATLDLLSERGADAGQMARLRDASTPARASTSAGSRWVRAPPASWRRRRRKPGDHRAHRGSWARAAPDRP
jgi:hypothetical protein